MTKVLSSIITNSHTNKIKHKKFNPDQSILKVILKRYDFNLDLKASTDGEDLICIGGGFHNRRAVTEKAISPFDFIWYIMQYRNDRLTHNTSMNFVL